MAKVSLKVKWGKSKYDVDVETNEPVELFKAQVLSLFRINLMANVQLCETNGAVCMIVSCACTLCMHTTLCIHKTACLVNVLTFVSCAAF